MNFMQSSAKHFVLIKAAREISKEIKKAGLENLKILADAGRSIVGTYLQGCSPQEKIAYRRSLNVLLQMGITVDEVLEEVARQITELTPIIESKQEYKKKELRELERFLKGG